jgi:riboflavin synthase
MFSGIVQAVGEIVRVAPLEQGVRLEIDSGALGLSDVAPGDSICVQGACLTATTLNGKRFMADVSKETLRCTAGLAGPGRVNLEKAMRLSDALGGHLVTGHVDGVGEVIAFERSGESKLLRVCAPMEIARYVARKGSMTVDGVSLTVNRVEGEVFEVNLIPHTLERTTLSRLVPGAKVNLEVDLLARYIERLLESR